MFLWPGNKMAKTFGLGRGLDALIPQRSTPVSDISLAPFGASTEVAIGDVRANPEQPRSVFDDEKLRELSASIKEHGVIQPLIVSRSIGTGVPPYTLIAGERRWRAAMLASLKKVPVVIKDVSPQQTMEMALVENIQRADLNAVEEALAFQSLVNEFDLTHDQLAQRVGKSRVAVTNTLRLLKLPDQIQQLLLEGRLTEGHARVLLGLSDAVDQFVVVDEIIKKALSVRQAEEMARRMASPKRPQKTAEAETKIDNAREYETRLRETLGTKVGIERSRKGGRIVIEFYSDEEFTTVFSKIVKDSD